MRNFAFFVLVAFVFFACDFEDNQAPTLLWAKLNGKEESVTFAVPGDTLVFEAHFRDDYNLAFFTLKVVQHPAVPSRLHAPKVFLLDTTFKIGGVDARVYKRLKLDSSLVATGNYTLEITYADRANNIGEPQERNFTVQNTCPRIELVQPEPTEDFFVVGKKIFIQGFVEDNDNLLDSVSIACWHKTLDKNKKVVYSSKPVWQTGQSKIQANFFLFEYDFTYEKTDTLELRIWARDYTIYPNQKRGKEMMVRKEMIFKK